MTAQLNNIYYTSLSRNTQGRDFVVGDIHGCVDKLERALDNVDFDPKTDRLICVGDLVDRGEDSLKMLTYVGKDWFYSTRGNHEDLAIQWSNGQLSAHNYLNNGGAWNLNQDRDKQKQVAELFKQLPVAIDVPVGNLSIGITHAQCPYPDWGEYEKALKGEHGALEMDHAYDMGLWSRSLHNTDSIHYGKPITGIDYIFVGHTPMRAPKRIGNTLAIDTAAAYEPNNPLTLVNLHDFSLNPFVDDALTANL